MIQLTTEVHSDPENECQCLNCQFRRGIEQGIKTRDATNKELQTLIATSQRATRALKFSFAAITAAAISVAAAALANALTRHP